MITMKKIDELLTALDSSDVRSVLTFHVEATEFETLLALIPQARAELAARDAREICSECGISRIDAILAVVDGAAACCPDCTTLTVEERNLIRARVSDSAEPRQEPTA